jgi:SNF2 family DNA or RNA helicase
LFDSNAGTKPEYALCLDSQDLFEDKVIYVGENKRVLGYSDEDESAMCASKKSKVSYDVENFSDGDTKVVNDTGNKSSSSGIWKSILSGTSVKSGKKGKTTKTGVRDSTDAKSSTKIAPSGPLVGEKVLIFCHHKCVMDAIEDFMRDLNIMYIRIDGDVSISLRDNLIHTFQM